MQRKNADYRSGFEWDFEGLSLLGFDISEADQLGSGLAFLFEALDNDTHVEVLDACHERDQICEEGVDDTGDSIGECDWQMGVGWMY